MSWGNSTVGIPEAAFWCSLFILEALVIIVGNLLTSFVFLWSRRLRKRRHYLLINLAISDTFVGAFAMPLFIALFGTKFKLWTFGGVPWEIHLFADMFSGFASIVFLAMIALERLYATLRPFNYRALKSIWYIAVIHIAWICSGLIPVINIIAPKSQRKFSSSNLILALWIPFLSALLVIISGSYAVIWRRVRAVNRSARPDAVDKESSLSRICLIVTIISLIAWLPFVVVNMFFLFSPAYVNFHLFYITKLLHYANSLLNPVLYVLKIPAFRSKLAGMFKKDVERTGDISLPLTRR